MKASYQQEIIAAVLKLYPELSGLAVDTTAIYSPVVSGEYKIAVYGPDVTLYEKQPVMYIDSNLEPRFEYPIVGRVMSFKGKPAIADNICCTLRDIKLDIDEW